MLQRYLSRFPTLSVSLFFTFLSLLSLPFSGHQTFSGAFPAKKSISGASDYCVLFCKTNLPICSKKWSWEQQLHNLDQ